MKTFSFTSAIFALLISSSSFAGTGIDLSVGQKSSDYIKVRVNFPKSGQPKYRVNTGYFSKAGGSPSNLVMHGSVNCRNHKYGLKNIYGTIYSAENVSKKYHVGPNTWTWKNKKGLSGLKFTFKNIKPKYIPEPGGAASAIASSIRKDGAQVCNAINPGGKHSLKVGLYKKRIKFRLTVSCKKKSGIIRPTSQKSIVKYVMVKYLCYGK